MSYRAQAEHLTVAGGLGIAKHSAATAPPGQKTNGPLFSTGWWSIIPSASPLCPTPSSRSACLQAPGLLPVTYRTQKPGCKSLVPPG